MLVTINTKELSDLNFCPNDFIFLSLLYRKHYGACEQFAVKYAINYDVLIERGYLLTKESVDLFLAGTIPLEELPTNIVKINELMGLDTSPFWELFSTYPVKVPSGDRMHGYRILRPGGVDAVQTKKLKIKYETIIGKDSSKHKHIMRCLEAEMWARKRDGSLPYMKKLETWLNQHAWEDYEHTLELSNTRILKQDNYGEKVV